MVVPVDHATAARDVGQTAQNAVSQSEGIASIARDGVLKVAIKPG
jgi:hypothetical protein